ncbi:MAG: BamA/TamA family outer membrane protein [Planctomycetaceae bacterium]
MFSPRIQNLLLAALLGLVATGCAGKGHTGLSSTHSSEVYDTSKFRAGSNRPPVAKTPSKTTSAKPAEGASPEMAEVIDSDQAKRPTGEDPSSHVIIRGQAPATQPTAVPYGAAPNYYTQPQPGYTQPNYSQPNYSQPAGNYAAPGTGYTQPTAQPNYGAPSANYGVTAQPQQQTAFQGPGALPPAPPSDAYGGLPGDPLIPTPSLEEMTPQQALGNPADLDVFVEETRTGRLMFGVTVNSNNGLTGQVTIDERNFDITRLPRGFNDPGAFRGRGQGFRVEAQPGSQLQRYLVSFSEPYLFNTNITLNTSAHYFDRAYTDYFESRYGGRVSFGYRLTPDLSASLGGRIENVGISNPRILGVDVLDRSLGRHDVYGIEANLVHDTRDSPFFPTEGHRIGLQFEQVMGDFQYSRGEASWQQYFLLKERADGSGRHTLAFTNRLAITGTDTPIYDRYFAGGFSTLRGFYFRGASPSDNTVRIGGDLSFLGSVEYFFPLMADDMMKGTIFCDYGTVEDKITMSAQNFRVAPGFGLRISVPALGPAPLALDFAFPVAYADTDQRQVFSFFFGATRQ